MPKIASAGESQRPARSNGRLSVAIILGLSLLSAAGASAALVLEARPLNLVTASSTQRWVMLRDEPLPAGLSIASSRALLDACLSGITSVYGRMRSSTERRAVTANCGDFAEADAAIMPSSSYAWYVASLAAAQKADISTFGEYWLLSATTGQNEQWLAGLRVALLEDNLDLATPELFEAERRDLAVLAMSRMGIGSIARRYVTQRDFRERVVSVVEQLPAADQARFLAAVTAEAGSSGASR